MAKGYVSEEDAACGGISAGGHLHSTLTVPSTALSVLFVLSTTTLAPPAWVKVGARGCRATLQARLDAPCKNLERERLLSRARVPLSTYFVSIVFFFPSEPFADQDACERRMNEPREVPANVNLVSTVLFVCSFDCCLL